MKEHTKYHRVADVCVHTRFSSNLKKIACDTREHTCPVLAGLYRTCMYACIYIICTKIKIDHDHIVYTYVRTYMHTCIHNCAKLIHKIRIYVCVKQSMLGVHGGDVNKHVLFSIESALFCI